MTPWTNPAPYPFRRWTRIGVYRALPWQDEPLFEGCYEEGQTMLAIEERLLRAPLTLAEGRALSTSPVNLEQHRSAVLERTRSACGDSFIEWIARKP